MKIKKLTTRDYKESVVAKWNKFLIGMMLVPYLE